MKFQCNLCENTIDIYKVKFTQKENDLVCEMAVCCDSYMEQVITDEYKDLPEIKRNDSAIDKGDKLWNDFKHNNTEK